MTNEEITQEYQTEEYNPKVFSYTKDDLRTAFEQSRCNKHTFDDWFKFNKYSQTVDETINPPDNFLYWD